MTKTQIWLAAFLTIFILLFLLQRALKEEDTGENTETQNTVPQSNMTSENMSGQEMINKLGCSGCHGATLEGTKMGPSLVDMKKHWDRESLINYLRNPNSFMDSDRFKAYRKSYPGIMMPSFNNVDVKDLGKIADYLLTE